MSKWKLPFKFTHSLTHSLIHPFSRCSEKLALCLILFNFAAIIPVVLYFMLS